MTAALDKAAFLAGRQCARRAWLEAHAARAPEPTEALARHARRVESARVLALAARRWPEAEAVPPELEPEAAEAWTGEALARRPSAILGAVRAAAGVRVRLDVLERHGEGWHLVDVRSGVRVRDGHVDDLAVQRAIARAAGVDVQRTSALILRRGYRREGPLDPRRAFLLRDLTAQVEAIDVDLGAGERARRAREAAAEPDVAPGDHCVGPWRCPYLERCGPDALRHVARPPAEARAAAAAGLPYFSPELGPLLDLPAPRAFLDFEAYAPALPRVDGAGPFEILPFLWACVREEVDGEVQIEAQAADGPDPRRAFATTLLAALPADGPILTWSAFEGRTLRRLATVLPELAARLHAAAERVIDLHAIVRAKVWHPDLDGSYSLKRVLPALAPERPWEDLAVSTGHDAAMLALGAENGALDPAEAARVRAALLRYCAADASALRTVLLALQAAAAR